MFSLYVAKGYEKAPEGVKYSYFNPQFNQTLIFAESGKYENFELMSAEEMLSEDEEQWLFSCKNELDKKLYEKHEEEIKTFFSSVIDDFEKQAKYEIFKRRGRNGSKKSEIREKKHGQNNIR